MREDDSHRREPFTNRVSFRLALNGSLPNDPPLLDELGIDLSHIRGESLLPLKILKRAGLPPGGTSDDIMGPILFLSLFALLLVLHGKLHFEYIYIISIVSCLLIYFLLNLISIREISLIACCNILGYSMGPVVLYSMLSTLISPLGLLVRTAVGIAMAGWSAYTASAVLSYKLDLSSRMLIIGLPLLLSYVCFILMVMF